jgi:hypothetical protein
MWGYGPCKNFCQFTIPRCPAAKAPMAYDGVFQTHGKGTSLPDGRLRNSALRKTLC